MSENNEQDPDKDEPGYEQFIEKPHDVLQETSLAEQNSFTSFRGSGNHRQSRKSFIAHSLDPSLETKPNAPLFSIPIDDPSSPGGSSRRGAVNRPVCQYGMDAVGRHVYAVESWIAKVHGKPILPNSGPSERSFKDDDSKISGENGSMRKSAIWRQVSDDMFPSKVAIAFELEDALNGLDRCLLEAGMQDTSDQDAYTGTIRNIIEAVATIPSLLKTIFLIEDEDDRKSVLDHVIMRRVLLCRYSVMGRQAAFDIISAEAASAHLSRAITNETADDGEEEGFVSQEIRVSDSWVLELLKTEKRQLTNLALEYLELISGLTVEDYVLPVPILTDPHAQALEDSATLLGTSGPGGGGKTSTQQNTAFEKPSPSERDMDEFKIERKKLFKAVSELELLLTYINALPNRDIERIAVAPVVNRAIEDATFSPFSVFVMFSDIFFHFVLLFAMREQVFSDIWHSDQDSNQTEDDFGLIRGLNSNGRVLAETASLFYLAFRIIGDIIATARTSRAAFLTLAFSFWGIVDTTSIVMAFFVLANHLPKHREDNLTQGYFYLSALTIGMLWLKIVGLLKVVNWKLATFVMAVDQIVLDIRLFLFIMVPIILSFGDMFYAIMSVNEKVCPPDGDDEGKSPFCKNRMKSYLAIYRAMVGDLDFEEYAMSPVTATLFALMTFTIVILLLNLLIALVDESYERSTMRSARLFGLARIRFISKVAALEGILHPWGSHSPSKVVKPNETTTRHRLMVVFDALLKLFMIVLFITVQAVIFLIALTILESHVDGGVRWIKYLSVTISIIFWYLQLVQISLLFTGWRNADRKHGFIYYFQMNPFTKYLVAAPIYLCVCIVLGRRIFGKKKKVTNETTGEDDAGGDAKVQWLGRMTFIDRQVQTEMSTAVANLKRNVTLVEARLKTIETSVQKEIDTFQQEVEDRLVSLEESYKNEMKSELAAWEGRVVKSLAKAMASSS